MTEQCGILEFHPGFDLPADGFRGTFDGLGRDAQIGVESEIFGGLREGAAAGGFGHHALGAGREMSVLDSERLIGRESLGSAGLADEKGTSKPGRAQNGVQRLVLDAYANHGLPAAPTPDRRRLASAPHLVQGPFKESGAQRHDGVAHGKLASLEVQPGRGIDAAQQRV